MRLSNDGYETTVYMTTTEHAGHRMQLTRPLVEYMDARVEDDGTVVVQFEDTDVESGDGAVTLYCHECDVECKLERNEECHECDRKRSEIARLERENEELQRKLRHIADKARSASYEREASR